MPRPPSDPSPRLGPVRRLGPFSGGLVVLVVVAGTVSTLLAGCSSVDESSERAAATTTVVGVDGTALPVAQALPFDADNVLTMKVVATENAERYTLDAPGVVPAGPLGIEFENQGQQPHDLVVIRPKGRVTVAQVNELLSGPAPEAVTTIAELLGGAAVVRAQGRQSATVRVAPGEYFLASLHRGSDGRLDAAHGMYRRLTVVPPSEPVARRAKPPYDNAAVSITDDGVTLPDGFGLVGWYRVANDGTRPHELTIIKLQDGVTPDDAKEWLKAVETGPPPKPAPFTYVGGSSALDPKQADSVRLDLGKGAFVAFCSLPDRQHEFAAGYESGLFVPFTRA